ncbi:unnamed protein product [Ectocarpus fasciculatus]
MYSGSTWWSADLLALGISACCWVGNMARTPVCVWRTTTAELGWWCDVGNCDVCVGSGLPLLMPAARVAAPPGLMAGEKLHSFRRGEEGEAIIRRSGDIYLRLVVAGGVWGEGDECEQASDGTHVSSSSCVRLRSYYCTNHRRAGATPFKKFLKNVPDMAQKARIRGPRGTLANQPQVAPTAERHKSDRADTLSTYR